MAILWTDVVIIAPELEDVLEARQDAILADVDLQINETAWGARADLGRKYLAAHLATVSGQGGASIAGPVISEAYGDVSIGYAAPTGAASDSSALGSTSYGREYSRLLRLNVARVGFVV